MTPAQEEHLARITSEFSTRCSIKYRQGQLEHGGNLWELPLLQLIDNAIDEAIDQQVYLQTIRDKVVKFLAELEADRLDAKATTEKRDTSR
jgi:hypothetical protein